MVEIGEEDWEIEDEAGQADEREVDTNWIGGSRAEDE